LPVYYATANSMHEMLGSIRNTSNSHLFFNFMYIALNCVSVSCSWIFTVKPVIRGHDVWDKEKVSL